MRRRPSAATRDAFHSRRTEGRKFWFVITVCAIGAIAFAYRLVEGLLSGSIEAPLKGNWLATWANEPGLFLIFAALNATFAALLGFAGVFLVRDRWFPHRRHDPAPTIPTNFSNK